MDDIHDCMFLREEVGSHRQEVMAPDSFGYTSLSPVIVTVITVTMIKITNTVLKVLRGMFHSAWHIMCIQQMFDIIVILSTKRKKILIK